MNLLVLLLVIEVILQNVIANERRSDSFKWTNQRIAEHGYPVETHNVRTEDGYIITVFRIPYSHKLQNQNHQRPIVLLQHGLLSSSDSWLLLGPNHSLAYLLSDAGFDVWLGNSRGNFYARKHENISEYSTEFWRFSWHEIGHYDLPAIIDYALAQRANDSAASLYYVGFSQGTTACLVLLTTRPSFNEKIKMAHLLAPVAYVRNMNDKLVRILAPLLGQTTTPAASLVGGQQFLPQNELFVKLSYNICKNKATQTMGLCSAIAFMLEGDLEKLNRTALRLLAETHPAGCSTNQMLHYMQEQQSGRFCHFDFGVAQNMASYGQMEPPDYDLTQLTTPLHLWFSDNDKMATVADVERLSFLLKNRVTHHVADPKWAHGDFILNTELAKDINQPIIEIMRHFEQETHTFNSFVL